MASCASRYKWEFFFLADLDSLEKKENIVDAEKHFRRLLIDFKKRAEETLPANESNGAYN